MRRPALVALVGLLLALLVGLLLAPGVPTAAPPFDALLAVVEGRTIAASDIALARALGVLGFAPSPSPIAREEIERFADVLLIIDEAGRIGISAEPEQTERAWTAVVARVGGEAALARWLDAQRLDRAWAHRLVEYEVIRARFFEARFAAFVFPDEAAVVRALGPGQHDEAGREAARARLIREAAERAQADWLQEARRRMSVRVLMSPGASIAPPFPAP
jgi:hypothetical protein